MEIESFNSDSLLEEFKQNRDDLKKMVLELEELKEKINTILPDKYDNRYKYFFEEKIKAITNFFNSILDIRKEINKSLKDEIEMRRKIDKQEEDIEKELDIRELATRIELIQKGEKLIV